MCIRDSIDTGAHYSCINADFARKLHLHIIPTTSVLPRLISTNGSPMTTVGSTHTDIGIGGYLCPVELLVIDQLQHNVIIGLNVLHDNIMLL